MPSAYTRVTKVYVSSETSSVINNKRRTQLVHLPQGGIQDVWAIEVSGWSLPNNVAPTFYPYNISFPNIAGDNFVDFSLDCAAVAASPKYYSFAWASKTYTFSRSDTPGLSYVDELEKLILNQFVGDVDYDGNIDVLVTVDNLSRTSIEIIGINALAGIAITMTLLFLSGANAANSAAVQMGFAELDYISALTGNPAVSTLILSPLSTNLRPRKYVDVYIDEAQMHSGLVSRIYTSSTETGGLANEARPDFFSYSVREYLKPIDLFELHVSLLLPSGASISEDEKYELEISVYSTDYTNLPIPKALRQLTLY